MKNYTFVTKSEPTNKIYVFIL